MSAASSQIGAKELSHLSALAPGTDGTALAADFGANPRPAVRGLAWLRQGLGARSVKRGPGPYADLPGRSRSRLGGLALLAIGATFFWQALALPLGSLHRMGPGLFPLSVASFVIVLGLVLVIAAPPISSELQELSRRPFVCISLSAIAFLLLVESAGLVPASFAAVLLAALSEERPNLTEPVLLAAGSSIAGWLLFSRLLGLPLNAFGA